MKERLVILLHLHFWVLLCSSTCHKTPLARAAMILRFATLISFGIAIYWCIVIHWHVVSWRVGQSEECITILSQLHHSSLLEQTNSMMPFFGFKYYPIKGQYIARYFNISILLVDHNIIISICHMLLQFYLLISSLFMFQVTQSNDTPYNLLSQYHIMQAVIKYAFSVYFL